MRVREYDISDWVFDFARPGAVSAEPGMRTFLRRAFLAVLMGVLSAFLYLAATNTHAEIARLLQWLAGMLSGGAVLYALLCLVQSVRITRDGDWLCIHSTSLWPTNRMYPLNALRGMNVLAQEKRSGMKSGHRFLGWRWRVLLHTDSDDLAFVCDFRRDWENGTECPERVAGFVQSLRDITGLDCPPPQQVGWRAGREGAYRTGRTFSIPLEPERHSETFHSLEEMPPDLRRMAEEQLARMRAEGRTTAQFQQYTVRDREGRTQTYRSLDEMPEELRQRFEEARREDGRPRE